MMPAGRRLIEPSGACVPAAYEGSCRPTTVYLTVVVWGGDFVSFFLDYCLPCLLEPGGVPEIKRRGYSSRFMIYTKTPWERSLAEHAQSARLAQLTQIEVVCIDRIDDVSGHSSPYQTMNRCHVDFIARAERAEAAMIFLSPDAIWSAGSLSYILDRIEKGKRAILIAGLRASKEGALSELEQRRPGLLAEGIRAEDLVAIVLRHPHRITDSLMWGGKAFDIGWPSHVYWRIGGQGLLARCFHLHTFYVYPRRKARPEVAHDYDWLDKVGIDAPEIDVVRDSSGVCVIELSPAARSVNGRCGSPTILRLADWVRRHAASDHRQYARQAIYFHQGGRTGPAWWKARVISGAVVRLALAGASALAILSVEFGSDDHWHRLYRGAGASGVTATAFGGWVRNFFRGKG